MCILDDVLSHNLTNCFPPFIMLYDHVHIHIHSKNLKHKVHQVLRKEEVTYEPANAQLINCDENLYLLTISHATTTTITVDLRQMRRFHTEKDINIDDEDLEFIVQQVEACIISTNSVVLVVVVVVVVILTDEAW